MKIENKFSVNTSGISNNYPNSLIKRNNFENSLKDKYKSMKRHIKIQEKSILNH